MSASEKKLWGGRFTKDINSSLSELNCSLSIDSRLYSEDIDGSLAYSEALNQAKIITNDELIKIQNGFEQVRNEWIEGKIQYQIGDEDVHTVNERRLTEICGAPGEKLHTGRSRNDQVITDVKLWLMKSIKLTISSIVEVIDVMTNIAEKFDILIPGYTHLQRAQPVYFGHWLLSHAFALCEDCKRFRDSLNRVDSLPLGSGAIAGNPLGIDREFLAKRLGFTKVTQNSMHTVGDRDFIVEFNFNSSMVSIHLSRLAEDLILYSSKEFGFIKISDEFSTGSSLMPQKRNPDSLELVRGLSGSIFGNLTGFMMTLKGLPSTYNKDLQMDKETIFNSYDLLRKSLDVTKGVIRTMDINKSNCLAALSTDMLATDWAYYLVKKGMPFRTAHHLIGKIIAFAETSEIDLCKIPLGTLKTFSDKFDEDISNVSNFFGSVEQYSAIGGTSAKMVNNQIKILKEFVKNN